MEYTLKEYQSIAVAGVLRNLTNARTMFHSGVGPSQFALSATTGAGKTVMASAVIEALFYGNDDLDFAADPGAVVLWFSDDPSLNEQSRKRLRAASDRIRQSAPMVVIQHPFSVEKLDPGTIYFLNTDKLRAGSLLTRGFTDSGGFDELMPGAELATPDTQPYSLWDTIANTIRDPNLTLYMVLDEAHRGVKGPSPDKGTIVKRLINGHGTVPPMPVVWGISATVERFEAAMKASEVSDQRIGLPKVTVKPALVQESGLLKDDIVLDIPAETGKFDLVLLRRGTRKLVESSAAWAKYATEQAEPDPVVPLMVLQVPNKPDVTLMHSAISTILEEWPELTIDNFANVLGEHTTLKYGAYEVPYISPESVQDATHVRVLIAKDAISTGWDCPRAEVMVSFRPAVDVTNITQLLGRMIRTPLARRVPGNDKLNSVECILPLFNRASAKAVVAGLMGDVDGEVIPPGGGGRRVLVAPKEMGPNCAISAEVWAAFDEIPSESRPQRSARPVKRLTAFAQALASDDLLENAGQKAHEELNLILDSLAARHKAKVDAAVEEVLTVRGETIRARRGEAGVNVEGYAEVADDRSIREAYREAARALSPAVAGAYVDHLAGGDDPDAVDDGLRDAYLRVAALGTIPEVREGLDKAADELAKQWFAQFRVAIKGLSDERETVYNAVQAMSPRPEAGWLSRPNVRMEETAVLDKDGDEKALPTRERHLLSDEDGLFPVASLNGWEIDVVDVELARPGVLAWYRNPSRGSQDSVGIAYEDDNGEWKVLRPDFVFFSRVGQDVKVSVVDPHSHHLSDALGKLRGLARYAEEYAGKVHRVESVTKMNDRLRVLDLTEPKVREAVREAGSAASVYENFGADFQ